MFLKTKDGLKIAAHWHSVENPRGYLILLHMMPATKESWHSFADFMLENGYSSIAIDLRGHGKSTGGPEGYKLYLEEDHQKSILDIEAAVKFLIHEGARPVHIMLVGASIGANLALQYVVDNRGFRTAILLSAGLNYYGLNAEQSIRKLTSDQRVMLVASRDDTRVRGNAEMNEGLHKLAPIGAKKKLLVYNEGGHGTEMFKSPEEPSLTGAILGFVEG